MLVLTVASVITMGSAISKSKHVFFMGAMVEHGILKKYLDDNCGTKNYKLCAYKDSLPERAYQFIWDEKSPLYKIGGWKDTKTEFNEIIWSTFTQPKYIGLHIKESLKATVDQLHQFDCGEGNGSFLQGTLLYERIGTYFKNDLTQYSHSKQSLLQVGFLNFWNPLFLFIVLTSLALLLILAVFFKNAFSKNISSLLIIFFIGILLNAWDCGTFANAIERLGCKMIWLIPFAALLVSCKIITDVYQSAAGSFKKDWH